MKRILLILLLLACTLPPPPADGAEVNGRTQYALSAAIQAVVGTTTAASCSQSTAFEQADGSSNAGAARTGRNYNSSTFTIAGSGTVVVKRVELIWKKNGTPTSCNAGVVSINNIAAGYCDETSAVATADSTFDIAAQPTDLTSTGFNFTGGASLTKGTQYCVLIYCASVEASGTDLTIQYNAAVTGEGITYSADGSTWTGLDTSAQWNMKLETCTE